MIKLLIVNEVITALCVHDQLSWEINDLIFNETPSKKHSIRNIKSSWGRKANGPVLSGSGSLETIKLNDNPGLGESFVHQFLSRTWVDILSNAVGESSRKNKHIFARIENIVHLVEVKHWPMLTHLSIFGH